MQNQARLTKYNQNKITMTTSPDMKAKPQFVVQVPDTSICTSELST